MLIEVAHEETPARVPKGSSGGDNTEDSHDRYSSYLIAVIYLMYCHMTKWYACMIMNYIYVVINVQYMNVTYSNLDF